MQEAAIIGRGHIICKTATKRDFQLKTAVLFVIMRYTTARSMDFSFETKEEMKQVLARYENAFYHKGFGTEDAKDDGNYTKGHFKRGVE